MFSYFQEGIEDITPSKSIDLLSLSKIIRDNTYSPKIKWIRVLRTQDKNECRKLKKELPYITPNCVVRRRNLKDENYNTNFLFGSGYVFIDIDDIKDVISYKQSFIEKYGKIVSMVCYSTSMNGISVLIKITNPIYTKDDFLKVWTAIKDKILITETIDPSTKDIGRAWFIPYDPEVYVNYENELTLELDNIKIQENNEQKRVTQPKSYKRDNNLLGFSFSPEKRKIIHIDEVRNKLKLKTEVEVQNNIVDFIEVDYVEVYVPNKIKDGTKHRIYTAIIHQLVYLNPNIDSEYIFSYLWFINNRFADPRMESKELIGMFNMVYSRIKETGESNVKIRKKKFHFKKVSILTKDEKKLVANKLNGQLTKSKSINKIHEAKKKIAELGIKVTQKRISEIAGLSLKTVQKYFRLEKTNVEEFIQKINNQEIEIVVEKRNLFKNRNIFEIPNTLIDGFHENCPQWVKDWYKQNKYLKCA